MVSPGVYTTLIDKSNVAQSVPQIGAAFIGPTKYGPSFMPTLVHNYDEFVRIFGEPDGNSYLPYAVKSYLDSPRNATIVRVSPISGYSSDVASIILTYTTASMPTANILTAHKENKLIAILAPNNIENQTKTLYVECSNFNTGSLTFDLTASFGESITSSNAIIYTDISLKTGDAKYISDYFSMNNTRSLYVYSDFKDAHNFIENNSTLFGWYDRIPNSGSYAKITSSLHVNGINLLGNTATPSYVESATPWIQSQTINSHKVDLFKIHTFSHSNPNIKVSIYDIKPSYAENNANKKFVFGTFSLSVRDINDSDTNQIILEEFNNLTFDITSPNYIANVIGDMNSLYEIDSNYIYKMHSYGNYINKSKYIRVEMGNGIPNSAIPMGMGKYYFPILNSEYIPIPEYITSSVLTKVRSDDDATISTISNTYFGFNFNYTITNTDYIKLPISVNSSLQIGTAFNLENCFVPTDSNESPFSQSFYITASSSVGWRRFNIAFQGGFDGFNPLESRNMGLEISSSANIMGLNCSIDGYGTIAYKKAIDTVSNPDDFDINMLVLPGIIDEYASAIITYANQMCESRQDVFFIFDAKGITATVNQVVQQVQTKDSNYSATYYPWVEIPDGEIIDVENAHSRIWVPPSVVIPGIIARNDKNGKEWFAPSGLNRGSVVEATRLYVKLTQDEMDVLYAARINPIVEFNGQGIIVWGQKTLQYKSSALDRINVRRLLITIKKYITNNIKYLVFEQNTVSTRQKFINIVTPYLESIKSGNGLYDFKVIMDETTNTSSIIDSNMMAGIIYLQPTKSVEIINVNFTLTSNGITFSN